MELTDMQIAGLDLAINEAALLCMDVNPMARIGCVTLRVWTLPEDGLAHEDATVRLTLSPIGRVAASLRLGRWNDKSAPVVAFTIEQLPEIVCGFGGEAVYGARFFDVPEWEDFATWSDRLSLDFRAEPGGLTHTLLLSQESSQHDRHLDVCLWFDDLMIQDRRGTTIPVDIFAAAGAQWWNDLF